MKNILWHSIPIEKVLDLLKLNQKSGLTDQQIQENRSKYDSNIIFELTRTNPWLLLFEGIKQPMMLVLLSISLISFIFREYVEAVTMVVVVFL